MSVRLPEDKLSTPQGVVPTVQDRAGPVVPAVLSWSLGPHLQGPSSGENFPEPALHDTKHNTSRIDAPAESGG